MNTTEQLQAWYENSLLSATAYGNGLKPGMTKEELVRVLSGEKVPDGVHLTLAQAEYFALRYEILAPTHTTDSGLQVNVFRDRETSAVHFAPAGTQFATDIVNDIFVADRQIGLQVAPEQQEGVMGSGSWRGHGVRSCDLPSLQVPLYSVHGQTPSA